MKTQKLTKILQSKSALALSNYRYQMNNNFMCIKLHSYTRCPKIVYVLCVYIFKTPAGNPVIK